MSQGQMVTYSWPVPLREDYTFRLIVSEGDVDGDGVADDIEDILAELGDEDDDYAKNKSGWAEHDGSVFSAVVIDGGLMTLVHECTHVAFYICKQFDVHNQEFFAMLIEWLFSKSKDYIK